MNSLRKGSNLPLEEEVEQLRKQLEESQRKLTITQEEMKKQGATGVDLQVRLRSWAGIDWTKPAMFIKMSVRGEDGEDRPAQGKIGFTRKEKDDTIVSHYLKFVDGYTVTNDIDCAKQICLNAKNHYAMGEVKP